MGVLEAIRAFTDAIDRMHSGLKGDMSMNVTDLAALRMMIMRERRGESVSPNDVSRHLRITTASTTKLLDRLEESGHIERRPHPSDRRARVVVLTEASKREFHRHFGKRLSEMREVAGRWSDGELEAFARFLDQMSSVLDPER